MIKKEVGYKNGEILYIYEIRNAAVYNSIIHEPEMFENSEFVVTAGDYNQLLFKVNEKLRMSLKHTANDEETGMLEHDSQKDDLFGDKNTQRIHDYVMIQNFFLSSNKLFSA